MIVEYAPTRRLSPIVTCRLDPELLPQDFDPEYGAGPPDGATLEEDLFGDLIGCDDIKLQLKKIRKTFIHAKRVGSNPREVRMYIRFLDMNHTGGGRPAQRGKKPRPRVSIRPIKGKCFIFHSQLHPSRNTVRMKGCVLLF